MFAGPMSESMPTSVTSFAHRRHRADSTASFTYLQDEDNDQIFPSPEEGAVGGGNGAEELYEEDIYAHETADLEAGELAPMRRISSSYSRASVHDRLLRSDSARTETGGHGGRMSQRIYLVNEDLTIAVAGFKTSTFGFAVYASLCIATGGLAFLLLRWLPLWKVRLTGTPTSLRSAQWVVIEVCV
jgi:cation-transporting ATPase 13A2